MGVDELCMGVNDKLSVVNELARKYDISLNEIVYVGDDINDLPILKAVGFSACPNDAIDDVKSVVSYVSPVKGGYGVIRDVIREAVL